MQPRSLSAVCLALGVASTMLACGSDVVAPSGSGGGDGDGGAGPTSSVAATTTTIASSVASSVVSSAAQTSTSSGPDCPTVLFADVELNTFANAVCCDEMVQCAHAEPDCLVDGTDELDTSTPGGDALYHCLYFAGWYGARVCDSGFAFEADVDDTSIYELAYCYEQNCCEEFTDCTAGGADVEGCVDCLLGGPNVERCAAVNDCSEDNCVGVWKPFPTICGSGIFDDEHEGCLEPNCCDAYNACTGDAESEETIAACQECFAAGGGELCDAAIACFEENCRTDICDSGLQVPNIELAKCLSANCCEEYNLCTDDGEDPDACLDCLNSDDGGPLCDDVIACDADACGFEG